ncbi:MAG: glutamine-hydrolyzing carbamoyl-phosphate synthase small subunit [Chthoniobacterales bacterium]
MGEVPAILALEDGRIFRGEAFGAQACSTGEICFNTSMTGYQEILTDPSYRGQIVAMTAPQIGNYGVNTLDQESKEPQVRGFVIEELSPVVSNWRAEMSLGDYLKKHNIPGIAGIDTRALTKHLRVRGAMKACLATDGISEDEALRLAREGEGVAGMDFVKEVTPADASQWDPSDEASRLWRLAQSPALEQSRSDTEKFRDSPGNHFNQLPERRFRIAAYDFGAKFNILRMLRQQGFDIQLFPATAKPTDLLAENPDGIFLSNGPGDPAALDYAHANVKKLLSEKPLFGICLGHQILAYAFGGKTFKLKFGHRGGNQPVQDLLTGKIAITSQNHGFAVDPDSLPSEIEVTHINLNDNTVAGMRHRELPVFSVQYHPEASPGPHDAEYFFREFTKNIEKSLTTC